MSELKSFTKEHIDNIEYSKPTDDFNGIIIIPTGEIHESGFGCMKFILLNRDQVVGCVGGCSDVININGIGGYGKNTDEAIRTQKVPIVDWMIDCLPCGYLRLYTRHKLSIDNIICSDFSVYAEVTEC